LALNNVTFNWTLTDMDTILQYSPLGRGLGAVWSNTFSGSKDPDILGIDSVVGQGVSAHTASEGNSQVTIDFVGTGIFFLGESLGSRLRLTVDSVNEPDFLPVNKTAPLFAFRQELPFGNHSATLSLLEGAISLQNVNVQTQILTQAYVVSCFDSFRVRSTRRY
jgi:hypothetical protein